MSEYAVCSRCSMGVPVTVDDFAEVLSSWLIRFSAGHITMLVCDACQTPEENVTARANGIIAGASR